ncbi:Maf-like protein [Alteromonas sp. KUL42]|uniref:Maf family protein n=1 Tax=Alteromonas sp. KUL42 TaxID=2480797 RepID=UPI0010362296|nr:nucleoside triphosphate pyrophosphatase [Alteromonas sp. KUL42]TAP36781.1 septum formation inhibitor Maf [Alteromonas sp. KUL42]GEA07007.1 Maf-like protein [Alteromonas sp. KUL42]
MTTLVLASSSPYRKMLLTNIGIALDTFSPDIDETPLQGELPTALSVRLAEQKAKKVALCLGKDKADNIIIGSDQVALVGTLNDYQPNNQIYNPLSNQKSQQLLGKPGTEENALEQLLACQGKTVSFFTALCLHQASTNTTITKVDETRVHFRHNTESSLRAYIKKERPLDCAGSFKSEGLGVLLFESIESRDPNSLIGLPIMLLNEMLSTYFDVDLLALATSEA